MPLPDQATYVSEADRLMAYFGTQRAANIISGAEFNRRHGRVKFYKLTPGTDLLRDVQYTEGLVVDYIPTHKYDVTHIMRGLAPTGPFTFPPHPDDDFESFALYFIDAAHLSSKFAYYPNCNIWEVEIPDNAFVCSSHDHTYYQTNKFILSKKCPLKMSPIWDDPRYCENVLETCPTMLGKMAASRQTAELCAMVVAANGREIRNVRADLRTTAICLRAVEQDGLALEYIDRADQTAKMCRIAVQRNGMAVEHVAPELMSGQVCKWAIQSDPDSLAKIDTRWRTEDLCVFAMDRNGLLLEELDAEHQTERVCAAAVANHRGAMRMIRSSWIYWRMVARQAFHVHL